jgi:hypothetical protein
MTQMEKTTMERQDRRGCMVVMERGAPWQCASFAHSREFEAAVVVYETPDEPLRNLLARVRDRCADLAAAGIRLDTAVLACGHGDDMDRRERRRRVAGGLVSRLVNGSGGRMLMVADRRLGPPAISVVELAHAVAASLKGSKVEFELREPPEQAIGPGPARLGLAARQAEQDA